MSLSNTTFVKKATAQGQRRWLKLNGKGAVLGRLASSAAIFLRGKHKPFFSPMVDCGDFVVVTHAQEVRVTGRKAETKTYFRHSGYAGGAKIIPYSLQMQKDPRKVVMLAVRRMLPKNRLARNQMRRLRIYVGDMPANIKAEEINAG